MVPETSLVDRGNGAVRLDIAQILLRAMLSDTILRPSQGDFLSSTAIPTCDLFPNS
jgi:hypothetical protein